MFPKRTVNHVNAPKLIQMNSERSSETGYGLVKTPGSIVTDFGKSQPVDPGWSKFDLTKTSEILVFLFRNKPNKT